MSKLRVHSFSISIDGFGAGPNQDLENPLGVGGLKVFDWFFPTRTWQRMHGNADGETGVDDDIAASGTRILRVISRARRPCHLFKLHHHSLINTIDRLSSVFR